MQNTEPELVPAVTLEERGILPKGTAYRMAKGGQIPSYAVGAKGRGVRFRVEEVLAALRRRPTSVKRVGR
jgi:excisionase family DNA binding protein